MKNVAALTEDGAFSLFFHPHPRGIWQLKSPHPWEFAIQGKKIANAWGSARGGAWAQVELTDALIGNINFYLEDDLSGTSPIGQETLKSYKKIYLAGFLEPALGPIFLFKVSYWGLIFLKNWGG